MRVRRSVARSLAGLALLLVAPLVLVQPAGASGTTVTQANFMFTPSTVTVTQGQTITVTNSTRTTAHTFTVTGHGIDIVNGPGESNTAPINLPPGRYPFICRFHVALGMKGTLVVVAAASPAPSPSSPSASPSPAPSGGVQTGGGGTASRPFPVWPVAAGSGLIALAALGWALRRSRA